MKTQCKNGNVVERFYDRRTRSSVTRVLDSDGYQVGEADYSGNKQSAAFARAAMIRDNGGEGPAPSAIIATL